ncbi:Gx transporter family protein [bacterium]|nr:Gx transporter family protein [bacterium]
MQKKIVYIAVMTAFASVLFIIENLVSLPLPWLRLGLANVMTLLALKWWGLKEGLLITLLRVLVGGLLSGRFLQPLFWMALSGGIGAALGMWLLFQFRRWFSLVGISVFGAVVKNAIQLAGAYLLLGMQAGVLTLLPLILFSSLVSGALIGLLGGLLDRSLRSESMSFHP